MPECASQERTDGERRASPRHPADLPGRLSLGLGFGRWGSADAHVVDLSPEGARIRCERVLSPGDWISLTIVPQIERAAPDELRLPPGSHRARVVCESEAIDGFGGGNFYGLRFARDRRSRVGYALDRFAGWLVVFAALAAMVNVLFLKSVNLYFFWYHPWMNLYALAVSAYILSRCLLALFYKPPPRNDYMPPVTVVIACKNEEASIFATLDYIYRSDYPGDRLQVIAVDDGSTDRTHERMLEAQERYPSLEIIKFPKNLGKRHGMAAGARKATGEILVYVDSDSYVRRDAIRNLVSGFADPEVGAVCGHARVANRGANLLTKMQEVRYYVAFRVIKAAESLFNAVTCCSGCLAAYRRSYLLTFLDRWLEQRFLGTPATFGDDRSLTNHILRRHKVLYSSEAVCDTIVPERWGQFIRQQLRWKKSWIRESLLAMKFMWMRHPLAAFFFYLGVLFPLISPIVVANALVLPIVGPGPVSYIYIYGLMLMAGLYGLIYAMRFRNGYWIHGMTFALLYMVVLVWQTYYALFTVRRNHWGTR